MDAMREVSSHGNLLYRIPIAQGSLILPYTEKETAWDLQTTTLIVRLLW